MAKMGSINWRAAGEGIFEKAGKIKRAHRIMIFVGTILLFGGAFYALDYMPKSEEIAMAEENVDRLAQQLKTTKIRAKSIEKIRERHAEVQRQFHEALKLLPDKREIPNLLKSISQQGLGRQTGISFVQPAA